MTKKTNKLLAQSAFDCPWLSSFHPHHSKSCCSSLHRRKRKLLGSCLSRRGTTGSETSSCGAKCTLGAPTCTRTFAARTAACTSTSCAESGGTAREGEHAIKYSTDYCRMHDCIRTSVTWPTHVADTTQDSATGRALSSGRYHPNPKPNQH